MDSRWQVFKDSAGTRVCPVCQTVTEKSCRECVTSACRVSLKTAEKELQVRDVLATGLWPVWEYRRRVIETRFGFSIDPKEETCISVKEQVSES